MLVWPIEELRQHCAELEAEHVQLEEGVTKWHNKAQSRKVANKVLKRRLQERDDVASDLHASIEALEKEKTEMELVLHCTTHSVKDAMERKDALGKARPGFL